MVNALEEYIGITDELYWTLKNGVDAYIETIKLGQKGKTEKISPQRACIRYRHPHMRKNQPYKRI